MDDIYQLLKALGIPYDKFEHEAVFTNEQSEKINIPEIKVNVKNLFLRPARRGNNHTQHGAPEKTRQFYLLTIKHNKRADLKAFAKQVGEKGFSFGNTDELMSLMKLTPGSVSPLGLMHDAHHRIKYFLDADLLKDEKIYIHPNINTATLGIKIEDFKKFLAHTGHELNQINI